VELGDQLKQATRSRLEQLGDDGASRELLDALDQLSFVGIGADATSAVVEHVTLTKIDNAFSDRPLIQAELSVIYAKVLQSCSRLEPALDLARKAHDIRTRAVGGEDEASLEIAGWIGTLLTQLGDGLEAESWLETYLGTSEALFGEDSPCTIQLRKKFGSSLRAQGRYAEAEVHHARAVAEARRVLGDDDPLTIACLRTLGTTLSLALKSEDALEVTQLALRLADVEFGPEDEVAIDLRASLARLLRRVDDMAGANATIREAVDLSSRFLGDRHQVTLRALRAHARFLLEDGFPEEAVSLLERVSLAREEVYGPGARPTTTARCELVQALVACERLDDAIGVGERTLADAERDLPVANRARVNARLVLAEAHEAQGDLDRARAMLADVLVHSAGFAEDHPVRTAAEAAQQRLGGVLAAP
jgi:tetratricopeptide (TPR) repeat protein